MERNEKQSLSSQTLPLLLLTKEDAQHLRQSSGARQMRRKGQVTAQRGTEGGEVTGKLSVHFSRLF